MGWNALNRYKKQKSIIVSLIELRNSNALVSVDNLINNLKNGPQALKQ